MISVNNSAEDLGKVFAVRRRCPTKIGYTQYSPSVTDQHEGDGSIPADIHFALPLLPSLPLNCSAVHPISAISEPGLNVSTHISSAGYSWGVSSACEASDPGAIPLVQAFTPPMGAAISRLLAVLQVIYRHGQHMADLDRLTLRLHRLINWYLWNATTVRDPFEQSRRDSLVGILQETFAQLKFLHSRGLCIHPSHNLLLDVPLKLTATC
ncbi:hypothetical protein BDR07DRAFT_308691 [Suillus spraguei]|nr:hypothetical protein BDR07DRAFT_308691 [Suillus spraguei]